VNLPTCTLNQSISCGLTDETRKNLPRNLRPAGLVMQSAPADLRARFIEFDQVVTMFIL